MQQVGGERTGSGLRAERANKAMGGKKRRSHLRIEAQRLPG